MDSGGEWAETETAEGGRGPGRAVLGRGDVVDKFIIVAELGAGGMGVVYEAYDPGLDRKVALKLLRTDAGGDGPRARLLREAQAMARVVHPNVVTVYEAGRWQDRIFLAMEKVSGGTLRAWEAAARPWQEVVAAFAQAGRGLAAAHDAGLVHRDFKPENVLVGDDGRVRVTDFGLVGALAAVTLEDGEHDALQTPREAALDVPLTEAGAVIGTPSYMAPEQHLGQPVGPAADQFAFCVSLHEALYRMRPFRGRTAVEVARSIVDGTIQPAPEGSHVPAWLHKVILRGLSPAPEGRWPSMNELLAALGRDPAARRRRASLGAGLLVVAAGAGLLARGATHAPELCGGAADEIAASWGDAARERTRAGFLASGAPGALDAWQRFASGLDVYAGRWTAANERSCAATRVRRVASEVVLDLRMACLDHRRDELAALVALYERPDGAMVSQAPLAVHQLAPSEPCAEVSVLTAHLEPPAGETADRVAEVRRQLARADALFVAGRYRDARAVVGAAVAAAGAVGFAPLQAEALFLDGVVAGFSGDPPAASSSLIAALRVAKASGHAATEADAWAELVWVTGKDLAHYDEALRVAEIARGASAASPDEAREALLDSNVAEVLVAQGRQAPALELHQRALARRQKLFGSSHPDVGKSLTNLGNLHYQAGRLDEAVASFRGAAEVFTRALGPNHVLTGRARGNLGEALRAAGRLEEAAVELGGARDALIAALGPDALQVAFVQTNLGILHTQRRAFDDGRAAFARARGIFEARRGAEHPDVAYVLQGMGDLELDAGEPARALPLFEQALAIRRAAQVDPVRVAETQVGIARALAVPGPTRDVVRARALLAEARPVLIAAGEGGKDVLVVADAIKL